MSNPSNIVLILSEHHASCHLGLFDQQIVQTPNLDALAQRGTIFENCYCASPICVPSRAAIATGLAPHQSGFWENSSPFDGRIQSWMGRLNDLGHKVVSVGKLHFRSEEDNNGFSQEIDPMHVIEKQGELVSLLRSTGQEPRQERIWSLYADQSGPGDATLNQAYDERITEAATSWLLKPEGHGDKPFVLCVHYSGAHPPFQVPQDLYDFYMDKLIARGDGETPPLSELHPAVQHLRHQLGVPDLLDAQTVRHIRASYFASLSLLDEKVGRVLSSLEASEASDDTTVIYTSDHGFSSGYNGIIGLFNTNEKALHVPMIMAGPDVAKGQTVSEICGHLDLFPTICEGVGEPLSDEESISRFGVSLWPAIAGEVRERTVLSEYHATGSAAGAFMLRTGPLKYVYHVGMPCQLFNVELDPGEARDLSKDPGYSETVSDFERSLREILDPEAVDRQAKQDQKDKVEFYGGIESIIEMRRNFTYSPPPGVDWEKV